MEFQEVIKTLRDNYRDYLESERKNLLRFENKKNEEYLESSLRLLEDMYALCKPDAYPTNPVEPKTGKEVPMELVFHSEGEWPWVAHCPVCGEPIPNADIWKYQYCKKCGQKLKVKERE